MLKNVFPKVPILAVVSSLHATRRSEIVLMEIVLVDGNIVAESDARSLEGAELAAFDRWTE